MLTSPIFIRYLLTVLRVLLGGGGGPKFLKFWLTFASSPIGSRSSSVAELHFCAPRTQWLGLLPTLTKNRITREELKSIRTEKSSGKEDHIKRLNIIKELQEKQFLPLKAIKVILNNSNDHNFTEEQKSTITSIIYTCPVAKSLHPDLVQAVEIKW